MKMKNFDLSLYLCTDRNLTNGRDLKICVENAIKGGITALQIREKNCSDREFFEVAEQLKKISQKNKIPLIINDRTDIAIAINADGVHVGQNDLPCKIVRKIIGENKIVGVSASTVEQAIQAEIDGADYIGVGAVFSTNTKTDAKNISINTLQKICQSVKIPVVAIGGINLNTLPKLKSVDIDGIAVVSAILSSENPQFAAHELLKTFRS